MNLKNLKLTQDAWLDGEFYSAHAVDSKGNEYMVHWEITAEDFENLDDESLACDWDRPIIITKL